MPDPPDLRPKLPPHSRAKHDILRLYLGTWFSIMANLARERRLDGIR